MAERMGTRCQFHFPYRHWPLTSQQMAENYRALERHVDKLISDMGCLSPDCDEGFGMEIVAPESKCRLYVPYKHWLDQDPPNADKEAVNLDQVMRWARRFVRECGVEFPVGS